MIQPLRILCVILFGTICNSIMASYPSCDYFVVRFYNYTGFTCHLTGTDLYHGYWYHKPSSTVDPGSSDHYTADQSSWGPDVRLTYECGNYTFKVRNQQNYCSTEGGDQTNEVLSKSSGIDVQTFLYKHASYSGSVPGEADIYARKTNDFALYAPSDLIEDSASSSLTHPAVAYKFRGKFVYFDKGTTHKDLNIDSSFISLKASNYGRIAGNAALKFEVHNASGKKITTYVNLTLLQNVSCLVPGGLDKIGNYEYRISSYHTLDTGANYSNFKKVDICAKKPYETTFQLGKVISGLFLPIEVFTYNSDSTRLGETNILIPLK